MKFRQAIFQNSKRLLLEAERLFDIGLVQTSTFLSITSIEEMGKFYLSRIIFLKNEQSNLQKKDLDILLRHPPKQWNSFLPPFPTQKKRKISSNISRFWELVADNKLMSIRNNCLYSGMRKSKKIIYSPEDTIKKEDAFYFLETAFEVIILQIDSLLASLDCTRDFLFLKDERKLLNEKLQRIRHRTKSYN